MSLLAGFFFAAVLAAVLLATIAIWAPRRTVPRAAAVVLAVTLIPAGYVALTEILGRPKPVAHEWWSSQVTDAVLLGTTVDEGRAIYLWVQLDGETRPRYYELPWRRRVAERIQEATDEAIQTRGRVEIRDFFSKRALGQPRSRQHRHRSAERSSAQASPAPRPGLRPEGQRHLRPHRRQNRHRAVPAAPRADGAHRARLEGRREGSARGIYSRRSEEAKVGEHDEDHPGSIP